jgi:hypothetical protein
VSLQVFAISDFDWWAGDCTPQEVLAAYMASTGVSHEEATGCADLWPTPLEPTHVH